MRTDQFFRKVWRLNALVILLAGVIAIGILAFSAFYALREIFGERKVVAIVNTNGQQQIGETFALGHVIPIHGHPWLLVSVKSDQKYDQAYFSKSSVAARNYGFVAASAPPRWLYPHNRFLVVEADQLPASEYSGQARSTAIVSFVVVQSDTDGNKRLTASDLSNLVFTKPDGTGNTVVLQGIRRVISQRMVNGQVIVFYEKSSGYGKVVVSSDNFSQVSDEPFELPKTDS